MIDNHTRRKKEHKALSFVGAEWYVLAPDAYHYTWQPGLPKGLTD
jgi:hypothetical protein